MKPKTTLRSFLLLAGSSLLAISYTHAANIWDGGGADDNWSTAANWDNNAVPGTSQALTFTGDVRNTPNNDLAAAYNTASISLTNDGSPGKTNAFTLGGGSITTGNITTTANTTGSTITDTISLELIMNSSRVFTTNQLSSSVQHNLIIGGVISQSGGSRSFTKQGAGTLTINGSVSNTFTGGLIVNGGLLVLDYANMATPTNLIDSGNGLTIKGGNVFLKGNASGATAQTFGNVTTSAGGNTLLIDPNGGDSTTLTLGTFDSTTQGASMLVGKALGAGSGTVTITTTTNKAATGIYKPRFVFADGASSGYDWLTTASVGSPYTLEAYTAYSALDTAAGTDTLNSRITGDASLGGSRTTNTLKIETPGASQSLDLAGNTLTLAGGGLLLTGINAFEIKDSVTGGNLIGQNGAGSHDLIVHQFNSGGLTISANIANNGGNATALTKAGTGLLTLTGSNTFTGGVFANSGELKLGAGATGALNNTANSENAVTISNGGTLSLNGNSVTVRSLNSANSTDINGNAIVQNASNTAATLTVGNSLNLASTFAGKIQDGTGTGALTINKAGTNTLTLSGTNTFTGGTIASGGIIAFNADAQLGAAAGTMTFNGGGYRPSLIFSSNRQMILNNVSGNLLSIQGNGNWTNTGDITGDGGLIVRANPNGGTTANLYGLSNTFKGALGVENGTGGAITVRLKSLTDSSTANGNIIFGAAHTTNGQTFEWDSAAGSGLTLGNRKIEFGGNGNAVGTIKNSNTTQAITINTDNVIAGTGVKTLVLDAVTGPSNSFAGKLTDGTGGGTLNLTKGNTGDWVLGGANTYSGSTLISRGTLSISSIGNVSGSASSLGTPSSAANGIIIIGEGNNTGTLLYTGSGHSSDRAIQINYTNNNNTGAAVITNNGGGALTFTAPTFNNAYTNASVVNRGLTLNGSNGGEIQGVIQNNSATNTVGLTKDGLGTWTLSGNNSYTGNTTVSGGTLLINGNQSLATGAVAVNGTSTLGGNGTVGGNVTVAATGTVAPGASVGTLNLAGNLTFTVTSGDVGQLAYELGSIAASDKIVLAAGKVLTIGDAALDLNDINFSNVGGLQNGTYTLIQTDQPISGTLGGLTNGTLGSATIDLQISGDGTDLELVVSGLGGGDTTPPTLTSITDNVSGGPVTEDASVTYTVTFNEDIDSTSVSIADFDNDGTAALTINSVTETAPTSGIFTVVATPTSPGTLKLRIPTGAVVKDTSNNDLVVPVSDDTTITVRSKYEAWSGAADFDSDTNGDGVKNGLAFLLGAPNKNVSALGFLPTVTQSGGNLILSFNMLNAANRKSASIQVQQSRDLGVTDAWVESAVVPEVNGGPSPSVNGVTFNVTLGSPTNAVVATVAASEAGGTGKLFGRLKANP